MGSFSFLRARNFEIHSCKNDVDPALMMLFANGDKRLTPISRENWLEDGGDEIYWSPKLSRFEYICSASQMVDRLELKGFTLAVAEESFDLGVRRRIKKLINSLNRSNEYLKGISDFVPHRDYFREREAEQRTLDILNSLTPQEWIAAAREIRDHSGEYVRLEYNEVSGLAPAQQYVLVNRWNKLGFPGTDPRCMLRLILGACDSDDIVKYDLTDLVFGEYVDSQEDMIEYAEYLVSREFDVNRVTVVLTEGATDRWILERSLRLLYPHLSPFFSFMDFDGVRLEGGAGSLANIVKAFAGARIVNRVVAVFDNDTAGNSARENLKAIELPPNIKVISLPSLCLAQSYPTLGPTGVSAMDVNGLACGIEMYLGREALAGADGFLIPIQWKGYDAKLGRYQGELLGKGEVLNRFRKILTLCESDKSQISNFDWSGLSKVIEVLRTAFHAEDAAAHLEYEERLAYED